MRLLVCGSRSFGLTKKQYRFVCAEIEKAIEWTPTREDLDPWLPPKNTVIIAGGAPGVDTAAIDWAVVNWTQFEEYKAEWDKYNKAAGPIRNQRMLDEGKPDKVLAINGGRGTADMVRRAKNAGIPVVEVRYDK